MINRHHAAAAALLAAACLGCAPDGPAGGAGSADGRGPAFTDVTQLVGLDFRHEAAVDSTYYMPESIGSGGGFLDIDADGDLDIHLLNGAWRGNRAGAVVNRTYRQESDGTFTDVTEFSGLGDPGYGMGLAAGDIDNDGDIDVYVTNVGPDALYANDGSGRFSDVTRPAGIDNPAWAASAAFFDYDLDGFLDLYVTNYVAHDPTGSCRDEAGRPEYCGPMAYPGVPDVLYRNRGDGTFEDVSVASGIAAGSARGLGVASADFDRDGRPDVYVANDGEPNHLWLNQENGFFHDAAPALGIGVNELGRPEAGMGIAVGDLDGDTDLDVYVTHLRRESNTLYRNAGALGFEDVTARSGLHGPSLPYTGFGTGFLDLENDGDLDLVVVNGRVNRGPLADRLASAPSWWAPYAEPNSVYENLGDGTFRDISAGFPAISGVASTSRGLALGDVDNDGDVDLLVMNAGEEPQLLRNDGARGHWVLLKVIDPALRRSAIGAEVTVWAGAAVHHAVVGPAYSFLSTSDPRIHFGLGDARAVDSLRVRWPGGATSVHAAEIDAISTISRPAR